MKHTTSTSMLLLAIVPVNHNWNNVVCFIVLLLLAACSTKPNDAALPPPSQQQPEATTQAAVNSPTNPQGNDSKDSIAFEIAQNMVQVEYCLPYPKNFKEKFLQDAEPSQKFFANESGTIALTFEGMMTNSALNDLYNNALSSITEEKNTSILSKNIQQNSYDIKWTNTQTNKMFLLKKWLVDNNETVTASFEYDNKEDVLVEKIHAQMSQGKYPNCE